MLSAKHRDAARSVSKVLPETVCAQGCAHPSRRDALPACLGRHLRYTPRGASSEGVLSRTARRASTKSLVTNAMRLIRIFALAAFEVLGVIGVVALEVDDLAVALEG